MRNTARPNRARNHTSPGSCVRCRYHCMARSIAVVGTGDRRSTTGQAVRSCRGIHAHAVASRSVPTTIAEVGAKLWHVAATRCVG